MQTSIRTYLEDYRRDGDLGVAIGLMLSLAIILLGVAASGAILNYISISSLLIVLGLTLSATLVNYNFSDLKNTYALLRRILWFRPTLPTQRIADLVDASRIAKRDGLVALERIASASSDRFVALAFNLIADGQQPDEIRRVLNTEITIAHDRNKRVVAILQTMGSYAPAMGLIGTLLGLIQMLGALEDQSRVGPAMSVALITTFYGAILANLFFLPLAGKVRNYLEEEGLLKAITVEAAASIRKLEYTVILEQRLQSFLPGR